MKKKVSIITSYPLDPIHPRTEMINILLNSMGFEVSIHNPFFNRTFLQNIFLKITLGYFDFIGCIRIRPKIIQNEFVIIQGLIYLPFSKFCKKNNIPVIYETLDNNVHLLYYYLCKKYHILKRLKFIVRFYEYQEKKYVSRYVNTTIVNSKALLNYFENKAKLIYYASPLEEIENNQYNSSIVLLYLGSFEKMKGAFQILDFMNRYNLPLIIIGTSYEIDILKIINNHNRITFFERIASNKLKDLLKELTSKYYLLGMSLTEGVNLSNATQELNKDIDYLAMGIPIIGNNRKPTAEKIEAGCGIFYNDADNIQKFLSDNEKRKILSANCKEYYKKHYSISIFNNSFQLIINSIK